jgi:hypothetical protein
MISPVSYLGNIRSSQPIAKGRRRKDAQAIGSGICPFSGIDFL